MPAFAAPLSEFSVEGEEEESTGSPVAVGTAELGLSKKAPALASLTDEAEFEDMELNEGDVAGSTELMFGDGESGEAGFDAWGCAGLTWVTLGGEGDSFGGPAVRVV